MADFISKEMKRFNHLKAETDAAYRDASLKLGLTNSASMILYTLCESGGECLLVEIIRISGLSKQTVNSALRKLEAERIVYLKSVGGRRKTVCLTETGRELTRRTVERMIQIENEIIASWTEDEKAIFLALNQRFLDTFKEKIKEL